ncbi:hypothetical protein KSP35_14995 [Aquihabitans sp. G128]|uniref:hypothetical protein n=1 Tax=Aquihabitans sp. G128 TaxID=2849779 RepID=UPI001C24D39A|nr:hypothetical protein [Aquihabitans sp. G128]QXC59683.1 hypothetical protein KSP35_14995 [Aquihabitans sp. G128]
MLSEQQVSAVIGDIANDMTGFIAASLVDLDSGMTLGVYAKNVDFDLPAASALNSELVKQKQKVMAALGLDMELEDMILTLTEQIHVIRLVSPSTFLYLAADRPSTNLAIVRNAINKHAGALAG